MEDYLLIYFASVCLYSSTNQLQLFCENPQQL